MSQMAGAAGRILWGTIGARFGIVRPLFGALGPAMALSVALFASVPPEWPVAAVGAVSVVVGLTAVSWHGLMFTEIVRLAKDKNAIGVLAGGVIGLSCLGGFLGPLAFALLLKLTGSYGVAFMTTAIPAAIAGLAVILHGRRTAAPSPSPASEQA